MKDEHDIGLFFDFLDITADNESKKDKFKLRSGERREVCILFADVKNSTVLGSQLDPEVFQSKLDPLMKRFTKCINYYGGYVDKYMGDGIMALFGAKHATEQDTERAVLAALKMIEQLELYNRKLNAELPSQDAAIGVRIGINTGLVVVGKVGEEREGDFTVTGAAVHLAQRMEANAPVGKILLPLQSMRTVERYFEFELFGNVIAKGFSAPVESYTVLRPRPEKGQRWFRKKSIFVGREKELQCLNGAFTCLRQRMQGTELHPKAPSIMGIKGDAGMGKTRLVHEFHKGFQNQMSMMICAASGIVHSPFNIFINLLEGEFKLRISEPLAEKKTKLEAGLARLKEGLPQEAAVELDKALPMLGMLFEIPYNDPRIKLCGQDLLTHLRLALEQVILRCIDLHHKEGLPVVLVLDDLHWLDEGSAAILSALLERFFFGSEATGRESMLLLMQYRHDYSVAETLTNYPGFLELELTPLENADMGKLVRYHTAEFHLSDEVINKVKELSSGNPFYLEEWCNFLYELPRPDLENLPIPANLHALILSRLDLLEQSIRILLQKAAVIGQEFFVDILYWIETKLYEPIDVNETLNQLEKQSFILKLLGFDYSAYFFKHITTRDVAYQTLLLENRKILHRLSAEAIEELYQDRRSEFLFALAEHYHAAEIADKAIHYLSKAAVTYQKVYSNTDAIRAYRKLLGWVQQTGNLAQNPSKDAELPPSAARVLINLSEIYLLTGAWDEAENSLQEAFDGATSRQSTVDLFDCHRLLGILAFRQGKLDKAKSSWDTCLELTMKLVEKDETPDNWLMLSMIQGNLGIWYQQQKLSDLALQHYNDSLSNAEKARGSLQIAKTLSNLGLVCLSQGDISGAQARFNECLTICREQQYLQLESIALGNLGFAYYKQKAYDKAMQFYEQKWLLVDKLDDKAELIKVLGNIANIHRDKGEHREALEYYRKVLALKIKLGNKQELAITHCAISEALAELQLPQEALIEIELAIGLTGENPKKLCEYIYYKATYHFAGKDYEQARLYCQTALELAKNSARPQVANLCEELLSDITNRLNP